MNHSSFNSCFDWCDMRIQWIIKNRWRDLQLKKNFLSQPKKKNYSTFFFAENLNIHIYIFFMPLFALIKIKMLILNHFWFLSLFFSLNTEIYTLSIYLYISIIYPHEPQTPLSSLLPFYLKKTTPFLIPLSI